MAMAVLPGLSFLQSAALVGGSVFFLARQQKKAKREMERALRSLASQRAASELDFRQISADIRKFGYGTARYGGTLLFAHVKGNGLFMIIAYATSTKMAFKSLLVEDEIIPEGNFSSSTETGFITPASGQPYHEKLYINISGLSLPTDNHPTALDTKLSSLDDDILSDPDFLFSEIAYIQYYLKYDSDTYPSGLPQLSCMLQRLTDDGQEMSNPSLALKDYLKNPDYGFGADDSEIDSASFDAAILACDALIEGKKRFSCNFVFSSEEKPVDIINKILDCCNGSLAFSQGKWIHRIGIWYTPAISLDESDMRGQIFVKPRRSRSEIFNRVTAQITDSNTGQLIDAPVYESEIYQTTDGEIIVADLSLEGIQDISQATRLMRQSLLQNRSELVFSGLFGPKALELVPGDNVMLSYERYGWDEKYFEVVSYERIPASDGAFDVRMTLTETAAAIFNEGAIPAALTLLSTNLPKGDIVLPPTALTTTETMRTIGDIIESWIVFSWTAPDEIFLRGYEVRYKKSGGSYIYMGLVAGNNIDFALSDAGDYDFEVRSVNTLGAKSGWQTKELTVTGNITKPDDLMFSESSDYGLTINVYWSADTANRDYSYSEIRSDSNFGNEAGLLYRGRRTSVSLPAIDSRTITVYGKHYDTSQNSSLNTASKLLTNAVPSVPSFSLEIANNIATIIIDISTLADDVIAHRIYISDTSGGTYNLVTTIGRSTSSFSYVLPRDEWDGETEEISRWFKVAAIDNLTDIIEDEAGSTSAAQEAVLSFEADASISVSAFSGTDTLQHFRLYEWGYDDISLFGKIEFSGTADYSQTVSLKASTWYSIGFRVDSGTPELSFTANGTAYTLSAAISALRFQSGATEEEVEFTISGTSGDEVSRMMLNEGRFLYLYRLHFDDFPIPGQAQDQLNIVTQQLSETLMEIGRLRQGLIDDGATITQQQYAISLRVSKNGVASSLNLTPQGAKISGRHIVLDGLTRFINSTDIVYGEITSISGSTISFSVASLKVPATSETFYQDSGSSSITSIAIQSDGTYTGNVSSGSPTLGFFADGDIPTTTIDGGLITTGTVDADAIISGSITAKQLKANEIFTERLEIQGTNNITIDATEGILIFPDASVNTYTSTASNSTSLTRSGATVAENDFIKIKDGNNIGIVKKVTGVDGDVISFSEMSVEFDSATVQFQVYGKHEGYTRIANNLIELVPASGPAVPAVSSAGVNWGAVAGEGKPQNGATVGADWAANVANKPTQLSDINNTEGTKLTGIATGATKNVISSGASAHADPIAGDLWYDTNAAALALKRYDGSNWNIIGKNPGYIDATKITSTTVESPIISGNDGNFSGTVKVGASGNRIIIDGANKNIRSENYIADESGWIIEQDGAQFNDVTTLKKQINIVSSDSGNGSLWQQTSWSGAQLAIPIGDTYNDSHARILAILDGRVSANSDLKKLTIFYFFRKTTNFDLFRFQLTANFVDEGGDNGAFAAGTYTWKTPAEVGDFLDVSDVDDNDYITGSVDATISEALANSIVAGHPVLFDPFFYVQKFGGHSPAVTLSIYQRGFNVSLEYLVDSSSLFEE